MDVRCLKCKGRRYCGREFCPLIVKYKSMYSVNSLLDKQMGKDKFSSFSPAPFVGHYGYPDVNLGILSPPAKDSVVVSPELYDAPKKWSARGFKIPELVDIRSSLINSRFRVNIDDIRALGRMPKARLLEISQELGMTSSPVDIEFAVKEKPKFRVSFDGTNAPMGPQANLEKLSLTSNPRVHTRVEKTVSDTDLKAKDALIYLYKHNHEENLLSKALSVGNFGLGKNRRLVPTRWSITATDDILGKNLTMQIREYPESGYLAYFGGYLGNYFLVLMFPEVWSYELFETYMPKVSWNVTAEVQYTTDYEPNSGRKIYAENCAGGYYAARLGVLEKLSGMKHQASCLVIRVITGEYAVPLGVWVVREAVRNSIGNKPLEFGSQELMLNYAKLFIRKKFGYDISHILSRSLLLKKMKSQKKLSDFF